jgi:hypothetical protein
MTSSSLPYAQQQVSYLAIWLLNSENIWNDSNSWHHGEATQLKSCKVFPSILTAAQDPMLKSSLVGSQVQMKTYICRDKPVLRRRRKSVPALIYFSSKNFPICMRNSNTKYKMKQTMEFTPPPHLPKFSLYLSLSLSYFSCSSSASSCQTDIKLFRYSQNYVSFLSSEQDQAAVPHVTSTFLSIFWTVSDWPSILNLHDFESFLLVY